MAASLPPVRGVGTEIRESGHILALALVDGLELSPPPTGIVAQNASEGLSDPILARLPIFLRPGRFSE